MSPKGGNPKFVKGVSGNPGGRPKGQGEWRRGDEAKRFREMSLQTLARCMRSPKSSWRDKISAADMMLNRTDGRPVQAITGEGGGPLKVDLALGLAETLKRLAGE